MSDLWAHLADRTQDAYGPKAASPCWPPLPRPRGGG